jgi:hypothetical protein
MAKSCKYFVAAIFTLTQLLPFALNSWSADATVVGEKLEATPRMWEVLSKTPSGTTEKFYILGISHNGLDVEYDDYLYKKVVPAFMQADVFSAELAGIQATFRACPIPWPKTKENSELLQTARDRLKMLMIESARRSWPAGTPFNHSELEAGFTGTVNMMAEYDLMAQIRGYEMTLQLYPHSANEKSLGREPVSKYLFNLKANIPVESVDTAEEMFSAYCKRTETRPEYFRQFIQDMEVNPYYLRWSIFSPKLDPARPVTQDDIDKANSDFSVSIKLVKMSGQFAYKNAEEERVLLCDRTAAWLPKMISNMKKGTYFYALGFAHLVPSSAGNDHCNGLLDDLKANGLIVNPVN